MNSEISALRASLESVRADTSRMASEISNLELCGSAEHVLKEQHLHDMVCTLLPFVVTSISPNVLDVDYGHLRLAVNMETISTQPERRVTGVSVEIRQGATFEPLWRTIAPPILESSFDIPQALRDFAATVSPVENVNNQLEQLSLLHDVRLQSQDDGVVAISLAFLW